jgi:hypothetical protein
MKRCPTCQRTYPDDSPGFCVNDGAQLINEEPQGYDPQKTMLASAPPPPPQYSNPQPPSPPPPLSPPPLNSPPQAAWPPPPQQQQQQQPMSPQQQPQQGQNWGGYYQQPGQPQGYPPQYGAPPVMGAPAGAKGLSLTSFILGIISFAAVSLIFMMAQRLIDADRDVAEICYWGSAATGIIAIVLGALGLISRKQRNKWMAILGLVLGIPGVLFFVYVALTYGF